MRHLSVKCPKCGEFVRALVPVIPGSQTLRCKDCRRGIRHDTKRAREHLAALPKPSAAEVAANRAELVARVAAQKGE